MGLAVALDVHAGGGQLAQIRPRERAAARAHPVRVDEERRGEAQLLEDRIGEILERPVAVIEGQHDGALRELAVESAELDELGQAHHPVAVGLEVPHLLAKARGGQHEPALRLLAQVVIGEDRHDLVAAGRDPGQVPRPARDHDFLAGREGAEPRVVLDHPSLVGAAQVALRERLGRVAGLGEGDDEVFRLVRGRARRRLGGPGAGRGTGRARGGAGGEAQRGDARQHARSPHASPHHPHILRDRGENRLTLRAPGRAPRRPRPPLPCP